MLPPSWRVSLAFQSANVSPEICNTVVVVSECFGIAFAGGSACSELSLKLSSQPRKLGGLPVGCHQAPFGLIRLFGF